ncbi:MAG: hypothetical protein QOF76_3815 [Solirubrobacteraceae bacterium]|nr:hypothetical protein [Solirubrobacteraceae bacterium]
MLRLTALITLLLAAPAAAGTVTIGSDLSTPASSAVSNPTDWNAWNTKLPGRKFRSPVQGELNAVRIKGRIDPGGAKPVVSMNVQVLRPKRGGKVQTIVTSQSLPLPYGGDAQQVSRYGRGDLDLANTRTCVKKGDYVSIFSSGGFSPQYPMGVPFAFFGDHTGATATVFKGKGGGANGDGKVYRGKPKVGQELLLQAEIGTGPDARYTCQTKQQQKHGGQGRSRAAIA